jgi:long-chain acyl-CoA synthetase
MAAVGPDDLATIIYTSGTTGTPKGVMLTHGNEASNLTESCHDFGWGVGWRAVSFLPLSHITARHVDYLFYLYGVMIAYCPDINHLLEAFAENKPSVVVAVPRVYEKIRQEAMRKGSTGIKKLIFHTALKIGARHKDEVLKGEVPNSFEWKLADKLVFRKIRDVFGGHVEQYISGGAPLGVDTALWFANVGIRIMEGYGLTETSPVIAVNTAKDFKLGTVGKPLSNLECKIAPDGELLVRGPSIFKSYWHSPEETAAAFEGDWFKTGDIGMIDSEGFLSITDRKKDLLKTSGGKFIAPQPIENKLKLDPLVAQAAVLGDKRKFASVLIQPNFAVLEDWARHHHIPYRNRNDLVEHPEVKSLYRGLVHQVNAELARFETMKRIILVPDEFTVESGELTPSLKLKRRVVEKKYANQIEAIYTQAELQTPAPKV